jgi:glycosyltransferase involved in cell wall biosynthesis
VNYEPAFEALHTGDFVTAVALLEKAAQETAFTSDIINHAYTLALYRAGNTTRLADVSFQIGESLAEHDRASAMDYFQRALVAGLDSPRVRQIGLSFEQWAAPVRTAVASPRADSVDHVAHIAGSLMPDHPTTRYLQLLVPSLRKQNIRSTIFTTESAAAWFFNAEPRPQSRPLEIEAEVKIASVEGDFEERASRIAETLRASGLAVAFFHSNLSEQITARVASLRPATIQVNVNHDVEMDADLFDARIHVFDNAIQRTRFSAHAEWIPLASDIERRLQFSEPVTRQSMGLESATSVSATFGNLRNSSSREYLRVLSEVLKRFPKHFHLFAGAGNVRSIRPYLHSEGVLPRVRFLGQIADTAALLEMIDVYLASFPISEPDPILDAMGAGKPVAAFKYAPDSNYNSAAELVGARELTPSREADYIDVVDRLLRNPAMRAEQGRAMLDRFRAYFRPEKLGERYKAFLGNML